MRKIQNKISNLICCQKNHQEQQLTKAKVKRPNIRVIETGLATTTCRGEGNVDAVAAITAAAAPANDMLQVPCDVR